MLSTGRGVGLPVVIYDGILPDVCFAFPGRIALTLLAALFLVGLAPSVDAADVTVFAAASLKEALDQ